MKEEPTAFSEMIELLKMWSEWMGGYSPNIGFPSRVPLLSNGGVSTSFDDLLDQSDNQVMKAIDASIESLRPSNRAAIYKCYTGAAWRFPRDDYPYEMALDDAHEIIFSSLVRKGVIQC